MIRKVVIEIYAYISNTRTDFTQYTTLESNKQENINQGHNESHIGALNNNLIS